MACRKRYLLTMQVYVLLIQLGSTCTNIITIQVQERNE